MSKIECILLISTALTLGGCSNIGRFDVPRDEANIPSVKSIVQQITCELARVADEDYQYAGDMTAGDFVIAVQLDLTVNDDGSLAPSASYTSGTFSFNVGAKLDAQREQNFTEQLFYSIKELREVAKTDKEFTRKYGRDVNSLSCPGQIDTPLSGDLGIVDSVHMAMNTPNLALNTKPGGPKAGAFGGYAKFVLVKNLNSVGPTYSLKHFKGPGSLAGISETNTDQVTFAFAERSATGAIPGVKGAKAASQERAAAQTTAINIIYQIKTGQIATVLSQIQINTR